MFTTISVQIIKISKAFETLFKTTDWIKVKNNKINHILC